MTTLHSHLMLFSSRMTTGSTGVIGLSVDRAAVVVKLFVFGSFVKHSLHLMSYWIIGCLFYFWMTVDSVPNDVLLGARY